MRETISAIHLLRNFLPSSNVRKKTLRFKAQALEIPFQINTHTHTRYFLWAIYTEPTETLSTYVHRRRHPSIRDYTRTILCRTDRADCNRELGSHLRVYRTRRPSSPPRSGTYHHRIVRERNTRPGTRSCCSRRPETNHASHFGKSSFARVVLLKRLPSARISSRVGRDTCVHFDSPTIHPPDNRRYSRTCRGSRIHVRNNRWDTWWRLPRPR